MMIRYAGLVSIVLAALAIASGLWLAACARPLRAPATPDMRTTATGPAADDPAPAASRRSEPPRRGGARPSAQVDPASNWSVHPMQAENHRLTAVGRAPEETFPGDYLSVPLEDLYDMFPAKGSVRPLRPDDIKAVSAEAAGLKDDSIVLGVRLNGLTRAYPRNVLAYHVAANDIIDGTPVLACFDAVSGACMAYQRPGTAHNAPILAASGAGFRATGLLYDERTESLWSILGGGWVSAHPDRAAGEQYLTGRPIAGPMVNDYPVLRPLASVCMTWAAWRKRHPGTTVAQVQADTGHDYAIDPYTSVQGPDGQIVDYYTAEDLVLALEGTGGDPGALADKAWVLGIALPSGPLAVGEEQALNAAAGKVTTLELNSASGKLMLHIDPAAGSLIATTSGHVVPPQVRLFWVAWRSQFPDTQVWNPEADGAPAPTNTVSVPE